MLFHTLPAESTHSRFLASKGLDCIAFMDNFDPNFPEFMVDRLKHHFNVNPDLFRELEPESHVLCIRSIASNEILSFCTIEIDRKRDTRLSFVVRHIAARPGHFTHPRHSILHLVHSYIRFTIEANWDLWHFAKRFEGQYWIITAIATDFIPTMDELLVSLGRVGFYRNLSDDEYTYGFDLSKITAFVMIGFMPCEDDLDYMDDDQFPTPRSPKRVRLS